MREKILFLLAVFSCVARVGHAQIKVLKAEKFIDTNAIFYKTYEAHCSKWTLSNDDIIHVLSNSEQVDGHEWHYYYSDLPADYVGEVSIDGKPAKFTINAGAIVNLVFRDSFCTLAYNKSDYRKYFLEGRDTKFEVNEKFELYLRYTLMPQGIKIPAIWSNKLILSFIDNHSPSWVNKQALLQTKHHKSDLTYSTTTVDGKKIDGEVYIIDTLRIGEFTTASVPVYLIDDDSSREPEAVIGDDILSKAVLGILFKRGHITLSSEVPDLGEMYEIKSSFTKEGIAIEVQFANNIRRNLFLDLGFNGGILMPESDFKSITLYNKFVKKRKSGMSTANGHHVAETSHVSDYVTIDGKQYSSLISTNGYVKERLLGLSFFQKFDFLILDYKHKKVLISKKL